MSYMYMKLASSQMLKKSLCIYIMKQREGEEIGNKAKLLKATCDKKLI